MKPFINVADLSRIFFRAKDAQGKAITVHAEEATGAQFDMWARSFMTIEGQGKQWDMSDRAAFCEVLWQAGRLHIMSKRHEERES